MRMRFSLVVMVLVTLAGSGPRTPSEQKVLGPPAGPPGYPPATKMPIDSRCRISPGRNWTAI